MAKPKSVFDIENMSSNVKHLNSVLEDATNEVNKLKSIINDENSSKKELIEATEKLAIETKKERKAKSDAKSAQKEYNDIVGESGQAFKDLADDIRGYSLNIKKSANIFGGLGVNASNLAKVYNRIAIKEGDNLTRIHKLKEDIENKTLDLSEKEIQQKKKEIQERATFIKSSKTLREAFDDIAKNQIYTIGTMEGSATVDPMAQQKRRAEIMRNVPLKADGTPDERTSEFKQAKAALEMIEGQESMIAGVNKTFQTSVNQVAKIKDVLTGVLDQIPLIGGLMSEFVNEQFKLAVKTVGADLMKAFAGAEGAQKRLLVIQKMINSVASKHPWIVAAAIFVGVLTIFRKMGRAARNLANELQMGKDQLDGQLKNLKAQELKFKAMNLDASKLKTTLTTLSDEFKDLELVTAQNAANIEEFAQNSGIGGDEVAKLTKQLMLTQGVSFDTALNMQRQAAAMAKTVGIAKGRILKDMATSAEEFAKFSRSGAEGLAEAAVAAADMGLNLDKVLKVAEGLINIEQSLTKEFEAQVLTGRVLNLEKARQAAFAGNEQALIAEIQTQVGGIDDFQSMNVLQKQAISEAIGLSVSDIMRLQRGESLDKQDTQINLQKENIDVLRNGFLGNKEELRKLNEKGDGGTPGLYDNVETAV